MPVSSLIETPQIFVMIFQDHPQKKVHPKPQFHPRMKTETDRIAENDLDLWDAFLH